jgi:2-dehydro-3-deoxy-D-gluconate 5-dehydrogenase
MKNKFDLTGKVAIVTGGSTGLGQGMSKGLAAAGAKVVLVDYVSSEDTQKQIIAEGGDAHVIVADLTKKSEIERIVPEAVAKYGTVDILVNNAGIIRRTPILDFSEKDWDDVMNLNSKTVFLLSQLAARVMVEKGYGKIINIASLLSFQGGIWVPSYAASKGAVAQITKAFANELASKGLTVNAIAPGYMVTNNTTNIRANEERFNSISERIPAGRWGTPEDVAGPCVFLASPASDYLNGHVLLVDGGWMAR